MRRVRKHKKGHKYTIAFLWYFSYLFIYIGLLFYRSFSPAILQYSWKYCLFLVIMLLPFFFPPIIRFYIESVGWKGLRYSIILSVVFLIIFYLIFSIFYYRAHRSKQEHLFDPYLQNHNVQFKEPMEKKEGIFRILCLGGSTTLCERLPESKRYPNILRESLQKYYPSVKIEVLNAGASWYTTKHSLINYATYCKYWNPDLVIVMHGINDLYRSFSPPRWAVGEYNDLWSHFYGPSISGVKPAAILTFEQHIYDRYKFYYREIMDSWYFDLRRKNKSADARHDKLKFREIDYPLERYVSLGMFEKHLDAIVNYVRVDASNIMLLTQPVLYKEIMSKKELEVLCFGSNFCSTKSNSTQREAPSYKSLYRAMQAFNRVTKKVALLEDTFFIDMANLIPRDLQYFIDDCHYTEKGARCLAKIIAKIVVKSELINIILVNDKG